MKAVRTITANIYVGLRQGYDGDVHSLEDVREICQKYVDEIGLCVSVTPTEFVYTGGREPGCIVGLINYPRFPSNHSKIWTYAARLAMKLKENLDQHRVSFAMMDYTYMIGEEV